MILKAIKLSGQVISLSPWLIDRFIFMWNELGPVNVIGAAVLGTMVLGPEFSLF